MANHEEKQGGSDPLPHIPLRNYSEGEVIFQEGDISDGIYFICSGDVEICKETPKGKVVLDRLTSRMVFGEMGMIDGKPRSAAAVAVTETLCKFISVRAFEMEMERLPPFMKALFRILTNNIRMMNEREAKHNGKGK